MYKRNFFIWILFASVFIGCCNFDQSNSKGLNLGNEGNYMEIADTIITDVIILNPDGDEWTEYTLRNLDKETLVDEIFKLVYKGDLKPYEFFYNEPLTIDDIKTLEKKPEFSRDKIAKVQFEEAWYFDAESQKMVKRVHSLMLAYEIYNFQGEIRGYKPAFKVYFNKEEK